MNDETNDTGSPLDASLSKRRERERERERNKGSGLYCSILVQLTGSVCICESKAKEKKPNETSVRSCKKGKKAKWIHLVLSVVATHFAQGSCREILCAQNENLFDICSNAFRST